MRAGAALSCCISALTNPSCCLPRGGGRTELLTASSFSTPSTEPQEVSSMQMYIEALTWTKGGNNPKGSPGESPADGPARSARALLV